MRRERTFKHSGDLGDLIYSMATVRHLGGGRIYLDDSGTLGRKYDGSVSGLTPHLVRMLTPLLESQPYVASVSTWRGERVDFDLDSFRDGRDYNRHNLCHMVMDTFGVPRDAANTPWLSVTPRRVAEAVFSRSPRYRNPAVDYHRLRTEFPNAVFVGLPDEHSDFVSSYGEIAYHPVNDFLEMAEIICGADVLVGNQSMAMALAVALGKIYVQETMVSCPNCVFDRAGCRHLAGETPVPVRCTVGREKRLALAEAVLRTANLPGEMAELGVYTGCSAMAISSACPRKTLHLFDTFKGIPETCLVGRHRAGDFKDTSAEDVRAFLGQANVNFHIGKFPGTSVGLEWLRFSFVHVDADTYQSTKAAIEFFGSRMVEGGIMAFDDWKWHLCDGVLRAVREKYATSSVIESARSQCWVRFPAMVNSEFSGVPMF